MTRVREEREREREREKMVKGEIGWMGGWCSCGRIKKKK
jgi:hypothetical protein